MRAVSADELCVGDNRQLVLMEELTRTQIVQYAGASGDYNPLHTDEPFATIVAGYPSVFGHGMLTMGAAAAVVTGWFGDGHLVRYGVRFLAQVWPGDRLVATAAVTGVTAENGRNIAELAITVHNDRDQIVLSGYAAATIDGLAPSANEVAE